MRSLMAGPWRSLRVAPLLVLCAVLGCGNLYRVHGKVTLEDGTPVSSGMVVFESKDATKALTARGDIQSDGSYELSTNKPGDGVPPGRYRVLVAPPPQNPDQPPVKAVFDSRYAGFATSGLEVEVQSGANDIPLKLTRAEQ